MEGCDAVIHAAAIYEVGIPASQRQAMREANVGGTERVLGAALEAKIPKVVYVSTVGVFGNTHGKVVDETYEHPAKDFTSCYEETKWEAHQVAKRLIAEGLPCVIVQPGGVYGPGDTSSIGELLNQFLAGKMPLMPVPRAGHLPLPRRGHRRRHPARPRQGQAGRGLRDQRPGDDGARGDRHRRRGDRHARRRSARCRCRLMKAMIPIGPLVGKMMGQPPNLRELISSADGVTFWASYDKAEARARLRAARARAGPARDARGRRQRCPAAGSRLT